MTIRCVLLLVALVAAPSVASAQYSGYPGFDGEGDGSGSGSGSGGWEGYGDCRDDCSEGGPCDICPTDECGQRQWCQPQGTGESYSCQTVPMMCCKGEQSLVPNAQLRVGKRFKVSPEQNIPGIERWLGKGMMEVEAYLFARVKENVDRDPNARSCTSSVTATGATGFRGCVARQCFGVNFIAGGEAEECTDLECNWPEWSCNASKFFRRLWSFFSAHVQRGVRWKQPTPVANIDFSGSLMGGFTASGSKSTDSAERASCGSNGCAQGGTTIESKHIAPWVGVKASGSTKFGWKGCETAIGASLRGCVEGSYNQGGSCNGSTENVDVRWKAALLLRGGDTPWSSNKVCFTCGWVQGCWDVGLGTVLDAGSEQEPACWSAISVN